MNVYTNICFFFSMLVVSSTAYAQKASKTYFHTAPLNIDTIFVPVSNGFTSNSNHIWLNTLNSQYVDTTKNQINSATSPAFQEVHANSYIFSLHSTQKQLSAGLYYRNQLYQGTQYGDGIYNAVNRPYPVAPYSYSEYTIKATVPTHYILPKF